MRLDEGNHNFFSVSREARVGAGVGQITAKDVCHDAENDDGENSLTSR